MLLLPEIYIILLSKILLLLLSFLSHFPFILSDTAASFLLSHFLSATLPVTHVVRLAMEWCLEVWSQMEREMERCVILSAVIFA